MLRDLFDWEKAVQTGLYLLCVMVEPALKGLAQEIIEFAEELQGLVLRGDD